MNPTWSHAESGAVDDFQHPRWDVVFGVLFSVGVSPTAVAFDKNCRAFGDPIDDAGEFLAIDSKSHGAIHLKPRREFRWLDPVLGLRRSLSLQPEQENSRPLLFQTSAGMLQICRKLACHPQKPTD